jgi:NAD(P)-dependent dehydrogenase (short-subunit alcohol dehydrogenase family)
MPLDKSDLDEFADEITFSSVAPLRVSRAFLPLIKKSEIKKIIFISSVLASSQITFMMAGQFNAYSVAKASLNMYVHYYYIVLRKVADVSWSLCRLAHKWAATLKYEGVSTAAIHPGTYLRRPSYCISIFIERNVVGWSQTPLGEGINDWMAKYAPHVPHFPPEAAAGNVIKISEALTLEKTGAFWHFDGTNLPW